MTTSQGIHTVHHAPVHRRGHVGQRRVPNKEGRKQTCLKQRQRGHGEEAVDGGQLDSDVLSIYLCYFMHPVEAHNCRLHWTQTPQPLSDLTRDPSSQECSHPIGRPPIAQTSQWLVNSQLWRRKRRAKIAHLIAPPWRLRRSHLVQSALLERPQSRWNGEPSTHSVHAYRPAADTGMQVRTAS